MTRCALCTYYQAQFDRALVEMLQLRLQVADGPRARVLELERDLARANCTIAARNETIETLRKAQHGKG